MTPRPVAGGLAALLLVAASTAACGDTGSTTTTEGVATSLAAVTTVPSTTTSSATTTLPPTSTRAPATTATSPTTLADSVVVVQVAYRDGEVTIDDSRVSVSTGDEVEIIVAADVNDELHVHGYDLFAQVAAGDAASLRFVADIPGIFEVELEGAGVELFSLEVS